MSIRLNETAIQPVRDSAREVQEGLDRGEIIYGQSTEKVPLNSGQRLKKIKNCCRCQHRIRG